MIPPRTPYPTDVSDNEQDRAQAVQEVTGPSVELAFVDQTYTGDVPAEAAREHAIFLLGFTPRPTPKRNTAFIHPDESQGLSAAEIGKPSF